MTNNLLRKPTLFLVNRFGSGFSRLLCTRTEGFSYYGFLSADDTDVVNRLISFFTKQPFHQESDELAVLGSKLNSAVVESALNGFKSWKKAQMFFDWASTQAGYTHSWVTYNTMASILSSARQNAPLKTLAMSLANSPCSMSPTALGSFVRCLGGNGLVEEASMVFDQVKKTGLCVPNSYSYNCLIEAVSKSSSVEQLEKRLKEMSELGWCADKYTLTPALQCYCNAGNFEKALAIFSQIQEQGCLDSHILSVLAVSFSKWGRVGEAFELIERMEKLNIVLNEKTFHVLIHGFVRENRVAIALQLFDKMRRFGFAPEISLYTVLIAEFSKKKCHRTVLCLLSQMKKLGITPDVQLIPHLISSLPGSKEIIDLFNEARTYVGKGSLALLYNSTLNGLVSNSSTDKAYLLLRAMMGDESSKNSDLDKLFEIEEITSPDTTSFSIVITGLFQIGKVDTALSLFKDMDRAGCKKSVLIYNNMINGLNNADRVEESYKLLAEMKESGFKPTAFTYNSIFGCLCRNEDVSGAVDMLQQMHTHGHEPWIKHSTTLVKNLCKNGRVVEACDFLSKMVLKGFIPDIVAYSAAIQGFLNIREVDQALALFRDICDRGCCPDVVAYNIILKGLCKVNRLTEAQEIFEEMLEKKHTPSVITYNVLIDAWCKNGDVDRALDCLSKMDMENREPNVISYTTVVAGLCNAGRSDDALMIWGKMVNNGCDPNRISYMALIHGLCKCGKIDEGFVYFQEMEEKQMAPDAFIYVALIEASISHSNAPLALDILRKMICDGKFPDLRSQKNTSLRDSVSKLLEDPRTSLGVRNLVEDGSIPSN